MATALDVLRAAYPNEIVDKLIAAYHEIEDNFTLKKWRASETDAGHFVEAARRLLECELFGGTWTPFTKRLPTFDAKELQRYELASGDESYRVLIPRVLHPMYAIRNKRGAGHVAGTVSANVMDATFIMYAAKWVLAELVRLKSGLSIPQTQTLVDQIVERRLDLLWKKGGVVRILDTKMKSPSKVLVHLLDQDGQSADALRNAIEYNNPTDFRKVLRTLHRKRLIDMSPDGICSLTTTGQVAAEALITKSKAIG